MSSLIRLVYVSRAAFTPSPSAQGIQPTVARILLQSRRNNPRRQIGGVLYYGNGYFFQCLEGASDAVNQLVSRLMNDERHRDFEILKVNPVDRRLFSNWSMKFIPLENDVRQLLRAAGHEVFSPDILNDNLIDQLVDLFASSANPESTPDQNYRQTAKEPRGLWGRIRSWLGL
jgi:hypothetical protein